MVTVPPALLQLVVRPVVVLSAVLATVPSVLLLPAQVPPLRVLRRELGALRPASLAVVTLGGLGFAALLLVLSSDRLLGLIAVALSGLALARCRRTVGSLTRRPA